MSDITIRDTAEGKAFFKNMEELVRKELKVGFFDGTEPNGIDVPTNAAMQEFGTSKMPGRPFMSDTIDNNMSRLESMAEESGQMLIRLVPADGILSTEGEVIKDLVQGTITSNDYTFDETPLIDSGTMLNSVKFKIEGGG